MHGTPAIAESALNSAGGIDWTKAAIAAVVAVAAMALNGVVDHGTKTSIVYLTRRYPEPGTRVFSALISGDPRIDPVRVRALVGGELPNDPAEQNRVWYRLYRANESDPSVRQTHFEWLLFRDLTWVSIVLGCLGCILVYSAMPTARMATLYASASVGITIVFCIVARARGNAFVRTVVAVASAGVEPAAKG